MKTNRNIVAVLAVAAVAFVVGRAGVPTGAGSTALAAGQPEGEMPPDVAAMMAAGAPGEHHEKLNVLIGIFDVSATMWMGDDTEPMEITGSVRREWIFGGRFIHEVVKANSEMGAFEGLGYVGYNNVDGQYEMVWMDTESTTVYTETGTFDDTTKLLTARGSYRDPVSGHMVHTRASVDVSNPNRHVYVAYETGSDGQERKSFEGVFTRR